MSLRGTGRRPRFVSNRVVECFMSPKDSHHRGATGKPGLLSHLKRPHGVVVLAIVVFGAAWFIWTFVVL